MNYQTWALMLVVGAESTFTPLSMLTHMSRKTLLPLVEDLFTRVIGVECGRSEGSQDDSGS